MKLWLLACCFLLTGCAHWVKTTGNFVSSKQYSVKEPIGWMRFATDSSFTISKDGFSLENIYITRHDINRPLAYTEKMLKTDMLPQETAEVMIDEFRSNPFYMNFKILENGPLTISNHDGFKILFTYTAHGKLTKEVICCGFSIQNWFYSIRYDAAQRYYFEQEKPNFEYLLKTFMVLETE